MGLALQFHPNVQDRPMRIQYGGSFDPVHNGHLAVAHAARDALDVDIWLMPAADPPHKPPTHASAGQRVHMLELALQGEAGLHVDTRELQRPGPSWSIDTVRELRAEFGPHMPLALLVGADSLLGLHTWKQWRELLRLTHFIIAERPGQPMDGPFAPELAGAVAGRWREHADALRASPGGCLMRLRLPLRPESSSALRQRIAGNAQDWASWMPAPVASYIHEHGLYHATPHGS